MFFLNQEINPATTSNPKSKSKSRVKEHEQQRTWTSNQQKKQQRIGQKKNQQQVNNLKNKKKFQNVKFPANAKLDIEAVIRIGPETALVPEAEKLWRLSGVKLATAGLEHGEDWGVFADHIGFALRERCREAISFSKPRSDQTHQRSLIKAEEKG